MRAEIEAQLGRDIPEWAAFSDDTSACSPRSSSRWTGIVEALDAIQAAGLATCVASSGDPGKIRRTLARTGLLGRFDGRIFSADDVEHGKPAPDLFLHAAAVMGVEPARCAVVEDSRHGVAAARSARGCACSPTAAASRRRRRSRGRRPRLPYGWTTSRGCSAWSTDPIEPARPNQGVACARQGASD